MANAVMEMLKKQREQINERQAAKFLETIKPLQGRHTYRFLPPYDGATSLFQEYGQHWIPNEKGEKNFSVVCQRKTYGDSHDCPVCNAISEAIKTASDDEELKTLKGYYAGQRYLANVLVLSDKQNKDKVQILEFGQQLYDQIEGLMMAGYEEDPDFDITNPETGYDIKINREGRGMDTSYTAALALKPSKCPTPEGLYLLHEEVKTQADKSPKAALKCLAIATGVLPPAAIEGRATASLGDLREVDVDEDVSFDDPKVIEHEASTQDDDALSSDDLDALDELDSLLDD